MESYPIPMVPGPVSVPREILQTYQINYGSADLESEYLDLYARTEANLKKILGTENSVVIQSGEGMLALWCALKSCLKSGDRVLSVATGVFGDGIGDMAESLGARVRKVSLPYEATISDMGPIEAAISDFEPKMITAVHCETPSGTLNPLAELGALKESRNVPLLYVDAVASAGGCPVLADEWHIDLCLGGSQKCLSSLPDMAFLSVSKTAWEIIGQVGYEGYDALRPYENALAEAYFPYTPNWQGTAALNAGAEAILREGLDAAFARHDEAAVTCREKIREMGLALFPAPDAVPSPTVTAVNLPTGISWPELDAALRQKGMVVGGSYGPLAGKIFRIGHMGSQADMVLVEKAMQILAEVLKA